MITSYIFLLDLAGTELSDPDLDGLFEAGCDDGSFSWEEDGPHVVFHREAPTPESAVLSAIRDVQSVAGVRVTQVHTEDDWMNASELAQRLGRTKQSLHQLIGGHRGPGDFPEPVSRRDPRHPLWAWEDVRRWFAAYEPGSVPVEPPYPSADFLAVVNDRLDLRERRRKVPDAPWWADVSATLPLVS